MLPLYTIGHGRRPAEVFAALLQEYGVQYLVDVRSVPYSRFNPQFNQKALKAYLEERGISYVSMGDSLGGRPKDVSCYTAGKVDYELLQHKAFFNEGIERLKTAYYKNIPLAIMCSESKPCQCHRSRLIGAVLQREHIEVMHIDEKGQLQDQNNVLREVRKGSTGSDLFTR